MGGQGKWNNVASVVSFAGNAWLCQGSQTACFGVSFRTKYSFRLIRNQITHSRHELLDGGWIIIIERLLIYLNISKWTFEINHVNSYMCSDYIKGNWLCSSWDTFKTCKIAPLVTEPELHLVVFIRASIVCDYLSFLICNLTSNIDICKCCTCLGNVCIIRWR